MKKQIFELTIIKQSRAILVIFLIPIIIFISIIIKFEFDSFIIAGLSLIILLFLLYYFLIGELSVTIYDGIINFHWRKKMFFNYTNIEPINEKEIKEIIVDNGEFIRKIITSNRSINLGTSKIKPMDSHKLISYFKSKSREEKYSIINSWESIPNNRLKLFYKLNKILLIVVSIILILLIFFKGFQPKMFYILLFCIPQLIIFSKQMKDGINKK